MPLFKWSRTAASNATADATINWAEGQAPSTVNDSARAVMAAVAMYRDDVAGAIVTTGTSTAYAVSSFSGFDSLADMGGQVIAFTPHTTNGATVTLNVDSLGAKPLRSAPNTELLAGVIIQGTPYIAVYNNTDGAFYLRGFTGQPYNIPLAAGIDYYGNTPPNSSFAFPYGQAISRTTYASLFALIGGQYGNGDGSTTFNLPDKRGRISVPLDTMGGVASGRITSSGGGIDGTTIGAVGGGQSYTQQRSDMVNHALTFSGTSQTWNINQSGSVASAFPIGPGASGGGAAPVGGTVTNLTVTVTPAGTIENLNGGVTQTAMKTMPPAIVVPYIMRII